MDFIFFNTLVGIFLFLASTLPSIQRQKTIKAIVLVSVLISIVIGVFNYMDYKIIDENISNGFVQFKTFEWTFLICMDVCFALYIYMNFDFIVALERPIYEQMALLFFIRTGCAIILSYQNFLMLFVGIEIISIPLYILTGISKKQLKGNEVALKYLLLGSLSTCILLMGICLIYGATGTFTLTQINALFVQNNTLFIIGLIFIVVSMSFKVSAAPFHFWTPDIYEGAPTTYTAFMASIVKSFFLLAFLRIFSFQWQEFRNVIHLQFLIIIAATLLIGNFSAVYQQGIKRFLAYSSISQVGFMLLGIFSFTTYANEAMFLYTISYTLSSISIFYIIQSNKFISIDHLKGFVKTQAPLAFCFTIFLLSLAGIPFTVGFISKYLMLVSALQAKISIVLLIIIAVSATVSVFYYFRLINFMFFKEPIEPVENRVVLTNKAHMYILAAVAFILIFLGMKPSALIGLIYS